MSTDRRIRRTARSRAIALAALAALAAISTLVVFPVATRAQTLEDVLAALDRTDAIIQRAETVVGPSQNTLAHDYLDQAKQFQARARSAFDARLLADALRLTDSARRRAFAAIEMVRQAGSAEFLLFALDRTDAFLDRVAPVLRECPNEAAQQLFSSALDLQRQAKDALRLGRPRVALSLTTQARERAARALRVAEASCGNVTDRARRSVERTGQLLTDSAWLQQAGPKASRAYEDAVRLNRQAEVQLEGEHYPAAFTLSLRARDQLIKALNRADRPLAKDAVADAVERSHQRLDQARTRARNDDDRRAVDRATERQGRAEDLLQRGRLAASLAEVQAVNLILERAGL